MKKLFLLSAGLLVAQISLKAQGQGSGGSLNANTQWKTTGNTALSTDFMGTTNQQSLILKSNNVQALEIKPTGDMYFSHLPSSNGDGIVKIGGGGKVDRIDFTHDFSHVLNGQGIFTDISTFTGLKVSGNDIIQTISGNIGIGTATPMAKLSVVGDGRFTGNLDAGSISFGGGQSGFGFVPPSGNIPGILYAGKIAPPSTLATPCNVPVGSVLANPGAFISYGPWGSGGGDGIILMTFDGANSIIEATSVSHTGPSPGLLLNYYCGSDVAICKNGFGNNGGSNGAGGVVSVGQNFEIGWPNSDYSAALNIKANGATAINVQNPANNASVFKVDAIGDVTMAQGNQIYFNGFDKLHGIGRFPTTNFSTANGATFQIDGPILYGFDGGALGSNRSTSLHGISRIALRWNHDGQVVIGGGGPQGNHADAVFAVYGKTLLTSAYVNISTAVWADYVFEKDYNLMPLSEVEKYYKINKHLPAVPSAKEMETKGDNIAETDALLLKKIEELTLYVVELEKQVKELKKANK